jgi:glycosyltransferase involved in cell wall biosynthesis
MKPKVTVGICVKNCEDYIKEAIDSIINQDFPRDLMELIIVDGYSKDRTLSILKASLERAALKYGIFCDNEGLGRARQIVVDNAGGDYIVWVDGDMVMSKDFVRKQVEFMEDNPDVGITKGKIELTSGANWIGTLEIYSRAASKMVDFNDVKSDANTMGTSGCIYRVKAIKQAGGFDESIKGYGEDYDAEYRIRMVGWLLRTTNVQYRDYERHGVSWKDLWSKYFRRGYDTYHFLIRKRKRIGIHKMLPPAAFLAGFLYSLTIYKLTRQKVVFLLPLQHTFKMFAWCLGYIHGRELYLFRSET